MGISLGVQYKTVKDSNRGEVAKCITESMYKAFPQRLNKGPFALLLETKAYQIPFLGKRFDPSSLYWWTDAQFVPNDDTALFITAGAFEPRTNHAWIQHSRVPNGRIIKLDLSGEKICGEIFSYTKMTNLPKVQMHPSGNYIGYIGCGAIKIETIQHEDVFNKHKDMRNCNYRYIAFSPNGKFMAILQSCSKQFELLLCMVDRGLTYYDKLVDLSRMFEGFRGNYYSEHLECKWTPDSEYIVVCSSIQFMFVLDKNLDLAVDIVEEILPEGVFPSWSSTFDLNPQSCHEMLAVGTNDRCVYFINLQSKEIIEQSEELTRDALDCLKYHPAGNFVAIATRNFSICLIDSWDGSLIYHLDMRSESPDLNQKFASFPNLIQLSFSTSGQQLATASCDGRVRVYQMPTYLRLFDLCKLAVLSCVPETKLDQLPLPTEIVSKLHALPVLK